MPERSGKVISPDDAGKEVLRHTLPRRRHVLELGKADRVVIALFKQVQLRLADTHLPVHFEEALTCIIERLKTHWLEC